MSQTRHAGSAFWEVDEVGRDGTKDRKDKGHQKKLGDPYPGHQEAMKDQGHMRSACEERFLSLADYRISILFSTAVPRPQSLLSNPTQSHSQNVALCFFKKGPLSHCTEHKGSKAKTDGPQGTCRCDSCGPIILQLS